MQIASHSACASCALNFRCAVSGGGHLATPSLQSSINAQSAVVYRTWSRADAVQGRPLPSDLWGKFAPPERGGPAWHPLVDHSTDVACVLEPLLVNRRS